MKKLNHSQAVSLVRNRMEQKPNASLFTWSTQFNAELTNKHNLDINEARHAVIDAWNIVHPEEPYTYKPR